jgi:O-antigen ligase
VGRAGWEGGLLAMLRKHQNLLDGAILVLVVFFTNQFIPICYMAGFFQPRLCEVGLAQLQLLVLLIITIVIFGIIFSTNNRDAFAKIWQRNWLIGVFVCLALLSNFWSTFLPVTILRSVLLLLLASIASYLSLRFSPHNLVNFIAITIGVFAVSSLLLGIFLPNIGIMSNRPYEGLWRGIFWHKIYLGAEMSLGYIAYLTILFSSRQMYKAAQKYFAVFMLFICIILAILSDSASGLIVFTIQTALFVLVLLWLSWGHLLNRRSYMFLSALSIILFLLAILNLDFIFGFFNRSATMTGRIPMWLYVLEAYVAKRPVLGYGIGTFWYQPDIPEKIQSVVGWGYAVGVSDSGYMDVLLGLGLLGLTLFLGLLVTGLWRSIKNGVQQRELIAFFPIFVLVHIAFINISLSYFLESESFMWFMFVLTLFIGSKSDSVYETS